MPHGQAATSLHLRKFVESTTVRGISRVFKTDSLVIRVIWILSVVACASLLIYQVRDVVAHYFRYEFTTVTKEDVKSPTVS